MTTADIPLAPVPPLRPKQASVWSSIAKAYEKFPNTWVLWILLLLITAGAAFLRFWRLDFQTYWTDEAHTIYRTLGNFDRMLKRLDDQGFPPGWYVLMQWWEGVQEWIRGSKAEAFAPESLRMLPAIFGTLTVPAMYLLARQFTSRRGALIVMLLTAVNPFFIYYSRDIKMYAALWFFLTINMALFFMWQNANRHWRYWLWLPLFLITGVCMVSIHSAAWLVIPLQLVFILTRSKTKWLDAPIWLAVVGVMSILPIYWYDYRTKWLDNAIDGNRIGVEWNSEYTAMNWKTIASLPSSHLLGFLWPEQPPSPKVAGWFGLDEYFNDNLTTRSSPAIATAEFWAILVLFAIMIVGLFPWRGRKKRTDEKSTRGRWWWVALWAFVPPTLLALTWLTPNGYGTVTSTAMVTNIDAPLSAAGIGLHSTPTSGSFKINVQCYSARARSATTYIINLQPDAGGPMLSLNQLANEIEAKTSRTIRTRSPLDGRASANNVPLVKAKVSPAGTLTIEGPPGEYITTFSDDTANILPALGIAPYPPGSWYNFFWSFTKLPPLKIWEPRYLGVIVPALLLWLGACIHRFPSFWLRSGLLLVVMTGCTISALSNHLIYRNAPLDVIAQTVAKYRMPAKAEPGKPLKYDLKPIAWNNPNVPFLRLQDIFAAQRRAGLPPTSEERAGDPPFQFWESTDYFSRYRKSRDDGFTDTIDYFDFLYDFRNSDMAAIVLTDRLGDLPDTLTLSNGRKIPNPICDEEVLKYLGPRWTLVETKRYRWYYEWRFNIFHTWRTRVFVLTSSLKTAAPPVTPPVTPTQPSTPKTPVNPPVQPPRDNGGTIFDF